MEIKNITELSTQQLANISLLNQKKLKKIRYIWLILSLLYFLMNIYNLWEAEEVNVFDILPSLLFLFGIVIFIFILPSFIIKRKFKKTFGEQGVKYNYVFKDDEMELESFSKLAKEAHVTYSYDSIIKIDFMDNYILLYMTLTSIMLIVDKKGFSSESEMDEVLANIKNKMKK